MSAPASFTLLLADGPVEVPVPTCSFPATAWEAVNMAVVSYAVSIADERSMEDCNSRGHRRSLAMDLMLTAAGQDPMTWRLSTTNCREVDGAYTVDLTVKP